MRHPIKGERERNAILGKLFNLKEWLTVTDAAQHLSIVFGEEVTEADIYRLALDGKLTLSVDFPNGAFAREGRKVPFDQAKLIELIPKDDGTPVFGVIGEYLAETGEVIQFDDKVRAIYGVCDLCMMHNERFDIEWRFYQEISDINRDAFSLEGVFVKRGDAFFNLQETQPKPSDEEFEKKSDMILGALKKHIENDGIGEPNAARLIAEHHEKRKHIRNNKKADYFPAGGLPSDSILVVRTEALREFEQTINGTPTRHVNVSDKLAMMNQASARFWANADRDDRETHPSNATVTAWLVQQGFTQTLAEKAATLIRPEWAPTGRKPEE